MTSPKFLERFQHQLSTLGKDGAFDFSSAKPVDFSHLPSPHLTPTNRSVRGTSYRPARVSSQRSGSTLVVTARKGGSPNSLRVKMSIDAAGPLLPKAKENSQSGSEALQFSFCPLPAKYKKDDSVKQYVLPLLSPNSRRASPLVLRTQRSRHSSRPRKFPLSEIRCKHV